MPGEGAIVDTALILFIETFNERQFKEDIDFENFITSLPSGKRKKGTPLVTTCSTSLKSTHNIHLYSS
jgi:hypothetical protein